MWLRPGRPHAAGQGEREALGGLPVEEGVRSDPVVFRTPVFDERMGVVEAEEVVLVQALVAEAAVEALDVGVLHRLAGIDPGQVEASRPCPCVARDAGELRTGFRNRERFRNAIYFHCGGLDLDPDGLRATHTTS